jgi:hypothetical protein
MPPFERRAKNFVFGDQKLSQNLTKKQEALFNVMKTPADLTSLLGNAGVAKAFRLTPASIDPGVGDNASADCVLQLLYRLLVQKSR